MAQPIQLDAPTEISTDGRPWWRQLTGYHWFVFLVASGAWLFDCLDQRLFSLARVQALATLMHSTAGDKAVQAFGKDVTAWFLIGWGIGGMLFGALGDRYGRARMLNLTVLIYSAFTGLTFFSHTKFDFALFRFLTGLGVGGVFGLAVALIAETVPSGARVQALGLLQVLSTVGNLSAGLIKIGIDRLETGGTIGAGQGWRWVFLVGAIPAAMVVISGRFLKEPEPWLALKASGALKRGGMFATYGRLFSERRWRRNVIVGALIASTGVIGLWAIGEYAVDLQRAVFRSHYERVLGPGASANEVKAKVDGAIFIAYQLNMIGAGLGMWLFTRVTQVTGRRFAFFAGFLSALLITAFVYWKMQTPTDAYWMMPLMGAAQLGPFAGFAIYLPELFPSSLRSTGTSFCYNLGRFAAAGGSFFSAMLTTHVFGKFASPLPLRYSAITMCAIFLIGLLTLPFAPETKGRPLPVDEGTEPTPEPVPTGFSVVPAGDAEPAPRGT
jgi:MFS family permease